MQEEITPEMISQAMELLPALWVEKHGIRNSSGLPFEFDDHAFMRDPMNDMSDLQVMLKPPQVGATEMNIIKTFYAAKKKGWDIIYTLPTQSDVHDIAGSKINRIVAQNPILMEWVRDHDTVDQKHVGNNVIHFRGTFSNKQAMMVSSDLNQHDEVDASDASVITQYETRLQAKAGGRRWYWSHPSIENYGVDVHWRKSDRKEWEVGCRNCRQWKLLSWPESVDMEAQQYVCQGCRAPLTTEAIRRGRWVATSKGEFSGYHISQLMCPWISATKIIRDFQEKDPQYFHNYVLGLPYAGSDSRISPEAVLKNVFKETNSQEQRVVIGVDTGLPIHYALGNSDGWFHYGKCRRPTKDYDPYDEIRGFLHRFRHSIVMADQGGDLIGIRKLQAEFPGRVYLCYYRKDRKSQELVKFGEGDEDGTVVIDRNRAIQLMVDQLREQGRIRLQGSSEDWRDYASHFGNIRKIVEETPLGAQFRWERTGPDHWVHASVYMMAGLDRFSQSLAEILGKDDFMAGTALGSSASGVITGGRLGVRIDF